MFSKLFSFRSSNSFKRGSVSLVETRALLHWKIMVIIFLFGVALTFISNFFLYRSIGQGELKFSAGEVPSKQVVVKILDIDEVVQLFSTKKMTFDQLRENGLKVEDPSW